jgi:hypothetical protein
MSAPRLRGVGSEAGAGARPASIRTGGLLAAEDIAAIVGAPACGAARGVMRPPPRYIWLPVIAQFGINFPIMDSDARPHAALHAALAKLLRPLFRLLLRHQVPFGAFEELAKRVYVDVALNDFGIPGKKPSISRASILSGLTRKEVQRLLAIPDAADGGALDGGRYNRAARVLTGWVRDSQYLDAKGQPRALSVDGDDGFASLVRRHSGDMPARAVLDELERVGAVHRRDDGQIELLARAYVPRSSAADKIASLGNDVADLIDTIDHNLEDGEADPRFQRKVMYQSIPASALPAFREHSAANAQALLESFDQWLEAHDAANPAGQPDGSRARVGVGIYYFEERAASAPSSADSKGDVT